MASRWLVGVVLLATALQAAGIARTDLPAQDGLKFIRVARDFQQDSWFSVVRGTDQHPLYPALIAMARPLVASWVGPGPDSWRLAAQGVSSLCAIALVFPLFLVTRRLFNEKAGLLAALLWVLLPFPAEIGRDTLSDSLALLAFTTALAMGLRALQGRGIWSATGAGLVAGIGYLARPEVAVLPIAILGAAGLRGVRNALRGAWADRVGTRAFTSGPILLAVTFLAVVGAYALVKGEVSEKLALRQAIALSTPETSTRTPNHGLPPGLDDPRWDFAPKEESEAVDRLGLGMALSRVVLGWVEAMAWVVAALAILGIFRVRAGEGRDLIGFYTILFGAILVRHGMTLGYISGRHTLSLVVVALPWASAEILTIGHRLRHRFRLGDTLDRRLGWVGLMALVALGAALQIREGHPSRWGHGEAGRWLAEHADSDDAILDTRGWASFVRDGPSYDYWHVRQALTDDRLSYLVVGADELNAPSRRAETLRAIVDYACEPAAAFPAREGGHDPGVLVFRYQRPDSWEAIAP